VASHEYQAVTAGGVVLRGGDDVVIIHCDIEWDCMSGSRRWALRVVGARNHNYSHVRDQSPSAMSISQKPQKIEWGET
jgi:hypothetical protein